MEYRDWLSRIGPTWLQKENAAGFLGAVGGALDEQRDLLIEAVLARMPIDTPADALDEIGRDRQLERGVGETDSAYRLRLQAAWDTWAEAGSHESVLRQLQLAGFTGMYLIQRNGRMTNITGANVVFSTVPSPWTFDSRSTAWYNQFGIVFPADVASVTYSGGTFSTAAATLNRLVRQWKPGKAHFMGTWIVVSAPSWGWPKTVTWGGGGRTWGGGSTRYIPPA
jgi:hypothetical protein